MRQKIFRNVSREEIERYALENGYGSDIWEDDAITEMIIAQILESEAEND